MIVAVSFMQIKQVYVCVCENKHVCEQASVNKCLCVVGEIPSGVYCTHLSKDNHHKNREGCKF